MIIMYKFNGVSGCRRPGKARVFHAFHLIVNNLPAHKEHLQSTSFKKHINHCQNEIIMS